MKYPIENQSVTQMKTKRTIMATTAIALLFHAANPLNAQDMKKEKIPQNLSAFPVGNANVQYAKFFIGQ